MSEFWPIALGAGLALLGILVALWDIWLTLVVNANVKKGFKMTEGQAPKAQPKAAPEVSPPVPTPVLRPRVSGGLTRDRAGRPLTTAQPRAASVTLVAPPAPTLKVPASGIRTRQRAGPPVSVAQPRAAAVASLPAPSPTPWAHGGSPGVRRHGYPPCQYRDAAPSLGEGQKLLRMGMNQVRAGNPGLALSLLYPSLEIFSQGAGTRGEALEAWEAIHRARGVTPTLYRRQGGTVPPVPKAGLHTF